MRAELGSVGEQVTLHPHVHSDTTHPDTPKWGDSSYPLDTPIWTPLEGGYLN